MVMLVTLSCTSRRRLLAPACRAGSTFPPSESVSCEGNYFPKWKSLHIAVYANRVIHRRKRLLKE